MRIVKIMRIFLILLGSIFLIWFAIPAIFLNVFNSGNLVGMIISAMILIYGIWMPGINGWIAGVWQNMPGRIFLSIVAIIATASIIFSAVVTVNIITKAYDRPDCETTVIVLGCQVHPWGPSLMLEERLIAAKEYLEENPNLKCILSGGQGENEPISEAECMYNWLVENGINADRLYMEKRSTSTRENLEFSKEIIEREGLNPKITIITNSFHQYRAGRIARSVGYESYSVSARTFKTMLPTYYVREIGGVLYEMIVEGN